MYGMIDVFIYLFIIFTIFCLFQECVSCCGSSYCNVLVPSSVASSLQLSLHTAVLSSGHLVKTSGVAVVIAALTLWGFVTSNV